MAILAGAQQSPSIWRPQGNPPRGKSYPPRGVVHTTETDPGTLYAVARNLQWPYHVLVDIENRLIVQLIEDLATTAYSLKGNASFETNHAGRFNIQVALVMRAKDAHKLSTDDLEWLAEWVFAPLAELAGIPNRWPEFYGPNEGIVLAVESSPIRMSPGEWYAFSGWCGHQHVPGQDHWDPGALNVARLAALMNGDREVSFNEAWKTYNKLEMGERHWVVEHIERGLNKLGLLGGPLPPSDVKRPRTDASIIRWKDTKQGLGPEAGIGQTAWVLFNNDVYASNGPVPSPPSAPTGPDVNAIRALHSEYSTRLGALLD